MMNQENQEDDDEPEDNVMQSVEGKDQVKKVVAAKKVPAKKVSKPTATLAPAKTAPVQRASRSKKVVEVDTEVDDVEEEDVVTEAKVKVAPKVRSLQPTSCFLSRITTLESGTSDQRLLGLGVYIQYCATALNSQSCILRRQWEMFAIPRLLIHPDSQNVY